MRPTCAYLSWPAGNLTSVTVGFWKDSSTAAGSLASLAHWYGAQFSREHQVFLGIYGLQRTTLCTTKIDIVKSDRTSRVCSYSAIPVVMVLIATSKSLVVRSPGCFRCRQFIVSDIAARVVSITFDTYLIPSNRFMVRYRNVIRLRSRCMFGELTSIKAVDA